LSGIAIFKKHYCNLLKSLPDNYLITLEKLCQCQIVSISNQIVNDIVSSPTFEDANKKILVFLIGCIKADQHILTFCDIMETIVNKDMEAVVHSLRDGKMYLCVCVGSDANNVNIITISMYSNTASFECFTYLQYSSIISMM